MKCFKCGGESFGNICRKCEREEEIDLSSILEGKKGTIKERIEKMKEERLKKDDM